MPSPNIKDYIIAGLVVVFVVFGIYHKLEIASLENDVLISQKETLESKEQSLLYKTSLSAQTNAIESLRVDYKKSVREFKNFKALPQKVKYKEIVKYLPSKTIIQRSNCEDINNYFSSLDELDLDSL